jgi:hypothetical protein
MKNVPSIIQIDWDLEDVEIDDLEFQTIDLDIETLTDDEIRVELGLPDTLKLPLGLQEEMLEAQLSGTGSWIEVLTDYLSDAYGFTVHNIGVLKTTPTERIPLEFKVTVKSARLPPYDLIGTKKTYDSERVLHSDLKVWLEKYYGLPKNVSIRAESFNIGFGRTYYRTLDAVFYLEENATLTKKMQERINKTVKTKTFRKDTTLEVKLELKDD